jgi:hypothetical protein
VTLLTTTDMQQILDGLTYPDTTLTAHDDGFEGPSVRATITVPDARTGRPLDLGWDWYPSPNDRANSDAFRLALAWRLGRHGNHEARELLQQDGRPVSDPHAPRQ